MQVTTSNSSYSARSVQYGDLHQLLMWRNHPDIRKFMLTTHEISLSEHRDWFERVTSDPCRCLLMIERQMHPLGCVQFSGITSECTDWGFYVAPGSPKGSGGRLANVALLHAFGQLNLIQVRGKALAFNQASIKLHRRVGFRQLPITECVKCDNGRYEELISFILDRSTWQEQHETNGGN